MTSQLPRFRCLFLSCQQQKNTERSFLFRDDFSENRHFFTKLCHCQTYQNYEQPPRTSQNSDLQSNFLVLKIGWIFPKTISKYICVQFLSVLFIILVGLTVTSFSEKMFIYTRSIHGFMSSSIKKSWTVIYQKFDYIIQFFISLSCFLIFHLRKTNRQLLFWMRCQRQFYLKNLCQVKCVH